MVVSLSKLDDPLSFVLSVLEKEAKILSNMRTSAKPSIMAIYEDHKQKINEYEERTQEAWTRLRDCVVEKAAEKSCTKDCVKSIVATLKQSLKVCQECLEFMDLLCKQYDLPKHEPFLFSQIGTLLLQ